MAGPKFSLQDLPLIVVQKVCDYLGDDCPDDLVAFARVSRYCYAVAKRNLFRTITLNVTGPRQLAAAVRQCCDVLRRNRALGCVSRLMIEGYLAVLEDEAADCDYVWSRPRLYPEHLYRGFALENRMATRKDSNEDRRRRLITFNKANMLWRPLKELIEQMQNLREFVCACPVGFSPLLLETIQQRRPQCRIRLEDYHSYCTYYPASHSHEDIIVAASSIHVTLYSYEDPGKRKLHEIPAYQGYVIKSMLVGLATGLRKVHVALLAPPGPYFWDNSKFTPSEPLWSGLGVEDNICLTKFSLHRFRIRGSTPLSQSFLKYWQNVVDFAALHVLQLEIDVPEEAMQELAHCGIHLSHLETATVHLIPPSIRERPGLCRRYYKVTSELLGSMENLSTLNILDWIPNIPLHSFSSNLKALRLMRRSKEERAGALFASDVAELVQQCPLLEVMQLTIRRSKGDATEVSIYQNLARLSKLESLDLKLCAAPRRILRSGIETSPIEPWFDAFDKTYSIIADDKYRRGQVKDTIMNLAMDKTLAFAIWHMIDDPKGRPDNVRGPLRRLEVQTEGWTCFGRERQASTRKYLLPMARKHVIERSERPQGDAVLNLTVERVPGGRTLAQPGPCIAREKRELCLIFRRIWPSKLGVTDPEDSEFYKGCEDDWHSLPLASLK